MKLQLETTIEHIIVVARPRCRILRREQATVQGDNAKTRKRIGGGLEENRKGINGNATVPKSFESVESTLDDAAAVAFHR